MKKFLYGIKIELTNRQMTIVNENKRVVVDKECM